MYRNDIPINLSEGKPLPQRGDLNAAWEGVNNIFGGNYDGPNVYPGSVANVLIDTLESIPRFDGSIHRDLGMLALSAYPLDSKAIIPKVFGVNDSFIERLDGPAERVVMVRNNQGELWRTLHTINARGYEYKSPKLNVSLGEMLGISDVVIEGTKLSDSERRMIGLWARKQLPASKGFIPIGMPKSELEDIPFTPWLLRLITSLHEDAESMTQHLRDCDIKVEASAEQPARFFNEKLESFILRETTRSKASKETYIVDRLPFSEFERRARNIYEKIGQYSEDEPIIITPDQDKAVGGLMGVFHDRMLTIGREFAASKNLNRDQQTQLFENIKTDLENSQSKLNVFMFKNSRDQTNHEINAVLVPPDFIETLWQTMDSKFEDEVIVASPVDDYHEPYVAIWYGKRYLLTIIPSIVNGHSWLHIDTFPPVTTPDYELPDIRNLISRQLGKAGK